MATFNVGPQQLFQIRAHCAPDRFGAMLLRVGLNKAFGEQDMSTTEQSVTTLVFPDDYLRQLNSVASVTTQNVMHLKRKFVSKAGWELVPIPLSEFTTVE